MHRVWPNPSDCEKSFDVEVVLGGGFVFDA
jgi:hypothetical protein